MSIKMLAIEMPTLESPHEGTFVFYGGFVPVLQGQEEITFQLTSSSGGFVDDVRYYAFDAELDDGGDSDVLYLIYPLPQTVENRRALIQQSMANIVSMLGGAFDRDAFDYDAGMCVKLRGYDPQLLWNIMHGPAFGLQ